jgi:hypothetical protein
LKCDVINNINITNINNNTQINNFDKSDNIENLINNLKLQDYRNIIDTDTTVRNTICDIMKLIYNNDLFPKNKNIKCPNTAKNEFLIALENGWKKAQFNHVKRTVVDTIVRLINDILLKYKNYPGVYFRPERTLYSKEETQYRNCEKLINDSDENHQKIKQDLSTSLYKYS